jgi:translation initiation factor 1
VENSSRSGRDALKDAPKPSRLVYSTRTGRVCPKCGWPEADCHCSSQMNNTSEAPVPAKITARLGIEKRGAGKIVTVIDGLPANRDFLETLARELKKSCGSGGKVRGLISGGGQTPQTQIPRSPSVEIQGDHRDRLREMLQRKGWVVKG